MQVRKRRKLVLFTLIGETGIQYIFRWMIKPNAQKKSSCRAFCTVYLLHHEFDSNTEICSLPDLLTRESETSVKTDCPHEPGIEGSIESHIFERYFIIMSLFKKQKHFGLIFT